MSRRAILLSSVFTTKEQGRCPTRVQLFSSCFVSPNGNSSEAVSSKISAMLECSDQLEGSEDAIAPNDIFAQVMGKDKPGHVRMTGQGICYDVWSESSRGTYIKPFTSEVSIKNCTTRSYARSTTKTSCITSQHWGKHEKF